MASDANYFHRIQTARKFASASYEPHYAAAERHLNLFTFARWFYKRIGDFVVLHVL